MRNTLKTIKKNERVSGMEKENGDWCSFSLLISEFRDSRRKDHVGVSQTLLYTTQSGCQSLPQDVQDIKGVQWAQTHTWTASQAETKHTVKANGFFPELLYP